MDSPKHQDGLPADNIDLVALCDDTGQQRGYKARCGKVQLFKDGNGNIGAVRTIDDERRFFPGITGNWAFERYLNRNPDVGNPNERH